MKKLALAMMLAGCGGAGEHEITKTLSLTGYAQGIDVPPFSSSVVFETGNPALSAEILVIDENKNPVVAIDTTPGKETPPIALPSGAAKIVASYSTDTAYPAVLIFTVEK